MRAIRLVVAVAVLFSAAPVVYAGNGTIDLPARTVNFTMNFRFPPTAAQLDTVRARVTAMSHRLWDVTEGQVRVGNVTLTCTNANLDIADYWMYANEIRSNSGIGTNLGIAPATGTLGAHVNQFFGDDGTVFAHEFGHYAFGLGDEYEENETLCWGMGWCLEAGEIDDQNNCLMQALAHSELCVETNHESLDGNNAGCLVNPPSANGAPCADNCQSWNTTTLQVERTQQERINGESCWKTMDDNFPALNPPGALPAAAEPGGFTDPTFTVTCGTASRLILVLDRSGSMAWSVQSDFGEICANGADDDSDGTIDETDCGETRMQFVRAAARSILDLASDASVRAGIVSFDTTPATAAPMQELAANLAGLRGIANGLVPGSQTAIGDALTHAKGVLDAEAGAADSKAAILVTDGHNTAGSTPESAVPAYVSSGIRLYAIATGEASNSDTISDVTANTAGYAINEPSATDLVTAIAELYAQYTNGGVVVPQTQYLLSTNGRRKTIELRPRGRTISDVVELGMPEENVISFPIEQGTTNFTALLAGSLGDMRGFGVDVFLRAPDATVFSSTAPSPGTRVTIDPFYTLIRIVGPTPGTWTLTVRGRAGAAPNQIGTLAVISDNPRTHLFADLDRHVVRAPGETVNLTLNASYISGLAGVDFDVTVVQPDGTIAPVAVTQKNEVPGTYVATLAAFPMRGPYELRVDMRTTPATINDPGENIPGGPVRPSLAVSVPQLQRSITRRFFVDVGQWPCSTADCDNDGILNEPTIDRDHDGVPAVNDPDDNNNEIPDAREPELGGTHGTGGGGRRRLRFGGAVGSSHPLGSLDRIADANIYGKLDLERALNATWSLRLMLGLAQFTAQPSLSIAHPRYLHLSANLQRHAPFGAASRWYVNGGPGWYRNETNATQAGINVGFGMQLDLASPNAIELGADYHFVNDDRGRFFTWHLGLLFGR